MKAIDLDSFLAHQPGKPTNLLGDGLLVPESRLEVFGESGIMKSVAVHNMAFSLAGGVPWVEQDVPRPLRVYYLQAEIADAYFWERTEKMDRYYQLGGTAQANNLYLERNLDLKLDTAKGARYLEDTLRGIKPDVVIIDPLYKFMSGDDNDQHAVKSIQSVLDTVVIGDYSAALVMVHHSRKPASYAGQQFNFGKGESRGHTTITDWFDSIVQLTYDDNKGVHTFEFEKVRNGPMPEPIRQQVDPDTLVFGPVVGSPEQDVLALLQRGPVPISKLIEDASKKSKVSARTVRRNLDQMARRRKVILLADPKDKRKFRVALP